LLSFGTAIAIPLMSLLKKRFKKVDDSGAKSGHWKQKAFLPDLLFVRMPSGKEETGVKN
jgi:hypothetical protein